MPLACRYMSASQEPKETRHIIYPASRTTGTYSRDGGTHTTELEVVSTHTEVEALLLESNLIKQLRPRCNILLRDDKSFPYILLRTDSDWAQLMKHRGARNKDGEYFGPFASAGAVNRTLNTLQKVFPLRSCSDSIFAGRTRPCLQYQIKRWHRPLRRPDRCG